LVADRFVGWAIKTRLVQPDLKIQRHRRGTSPRMSAVDQEQVVNRVVHTGELAPRDRAAAILVLVFGQQIEDVVGRTWDDVKVTPHPKSNRVFRGYSPGRQIDPGHLRTRLRGVFGKRAARLGTLYWLARLAPVAILAEAVGYSPATIERHAVDFCRCVRPYVAAVRHT